MLGGPEIGVYTEADDHVLITSVIDMIQWRENQSQALMSMVTDPQGLLYQG